MDIEKEPKLRPLEHREAPRSETAKTSPETTELVESSGTVQEEVISNSETKSENKLTLEQLPSLVDKEVIFRDPEAKTMGPTDDILFKRATVKRTGDGFEIVIQRANYYPLYTGIRKVAFIVKDQGDIDRLQISLPE